MDMSHGASSVAAAAAQSPVVLARAALRRLALAKEEPTPENYARAYAAEGGAAVSALPERARALLQRLAAPLGEEAAAGQAVVRAMMAGQWDTAGTAIDQATAAGATQSTEWANLLQRLVAGLERGSRAWTTARKKDSLARVLAGSRSDAQRLRERMRHLLHAWESETDEPACNRRRPRATRRWLPLPRRAQKPRPRPAMRPPVRRRQARRPSCWLRRRRTGTPSCKASRPRCAWPCPTARRAPPSWRKA